MADQRDIARAHWGNAQKIRGNIQAKLSNATKERGAVNYTTRFEEAEQIISEFRLACMNVIFHDFEYAVARRVEHSLWQSHVFMNGEYRKALGRLNTPNQVVQRRKLDKLCRDFLKTSGEFYAVYIQKLHQRFSIPELQQVARKLKSQPLEQPVENVSHPVPMRAMVLKSCQMTLVHMGDLARYRCQLSDKFSKTTFDKAADYYILANSLDPDDGSAHHQLAVLHQIPSQHFDIVYHFHRAIAVTKPHELALKNLEREFKSSESSAQAKKGSLKDQSQAMLTWFVRLHAFFFYGKHFSQQSELEEEVLHRAEVALKRGDSGDKSLLKMILVNMAAYDISTEKVKSSWTMEGSQSCQFLLRFNIRTMLMVLRTVHRTLRDNPVTIVSADNKSSDGESCVAFAPSLLTLLPLLRLYLAWTYVTRADLLQYQEYLEPYITDLYRLLADVLTALTRYIDPTLETVSSKYLLPEDSEAQGLRPLGDQQLPLFLHVDHRNSVPRKHAKAQKPHKNVFGHEFKQETESVWRIRDIIYCGLLLVGNAKSPIALKTRTDQGHDVETWLFVDATTTPLSSDEATLSCLLNKLNFEDSKSNLKNPTEQETKQLRTQSTRDGLTPTLENNQTESNIDLNNTSSKSNGNNLSKLSTNYQDSDLLEDDEMVDMVNKLLDPIDDVRPQSSLAQEETSYGMNSSTVNEILGNLEVSPIQPSPVSKPIPYLPWDLVYKPTPHRTNSQEQNQLSPNGHNVPRSASGQLNGLAPSSYLDGLSASYNQTHYSALSPGQNTGYFQASPIPTVSSPSLSRKGYGLDTLEDSRNAVLDTLRSTLLAQHGMTANSPSPVNSMPDFTNVAPVWVQGNGTAENPLRQAGGPNLERSSNRPVNTVNLQNSLGPPGQGRPELGHLASTAGAGRHAAISKPTNNYDTHHMWGQDQGSSHYRPQYSLRQHEPSTNASSLAFSNPSSLITGTPDPVSAAPANFVACNGHYYNATTPFGRLGDGVNNRADPTHFRNQLKAAIGTSELPYDQQILQAAMMDSDRKPRPK